MLLLRKLINYLKETRVELRHVNWPKKQQTVRSTLLVVGVSLAIALFLGFFDMIFGYILNNFILGI